MANTFFKQFDFFMTSQVEKRSFFDAAFEADVWDFVWRLKKEHNS